MKEYRISAAAIIIKRGKILLVRYHDKQGKSFLVGPGGGTKITENLKQTVIREVKEETGLLIAPGKLLFVEDLLSRNYRMIKVWFLCKVVGGSLTKTKEATVEGITEVTWYSKDQLKNEVVYPRIIVDVDWKSFSKKNWETKYLELKNASF